MKLNDYNQQFVDLLDDENFKNRLNEVKVFAKPMRTGKNFSECNFRIPHLIKKHDVQLHIATSPLKGIILENQESLQDLCTDNKYKYESDPETILRDVEKGYPVIAYMTNQKTFTQDDTQKFIKELIKSNIKISINVDEFDTWTLSHFKKAAEVKGYKMTDDRQYAASMYNFTSILAEHSPYTFGMTATASLEVTGTVDTFGKLKYTLVNPLVAGEQKQYTNSVAHIGKTTFFNFTDNLIGKNETENTIKKMLASRFEIEKITRLKRVANTTDAATRRYRYGQQPQIGAWNLARWLESLIPLMDEPRELETVLDHYGEVFNEHHNVMWAEKLGLDQWRDTDQELVMQLNTALQTIEIDMTIFFRLLSSLEGPDPSDLSHAYYEPLGPAEEQISAWLQAWWARVEGEPNRAAMNRANPKYVLRNWMAQLAIDAAEKDDYTVCEHIHTLLKNPYDEQPEMEEEWFQRRPEWARHRVGCSMLSCSS